ncbi:MAG: ABC transporter permease [Oligoflexales bacterium]
MITISELSKKRFYIFYQQKRAFISLCGLSFALIISLFGDFLCNHRPLFAYYNGQAYFPVLVSYPETTFGGFFETETHYKEPEIYDAMNQSPNFVVWPIVRYGPTDIDLNLDHPAPSPPDLSHPLGTDDRARDVLARLIFGFRLSVIFGLFLAISSSFLGVFAGAIQGYFGGRVDMLGQRLTEVWSSLPELFILIIMTSLFEASLGMMLCIMTLMGWMGLSAYVRAEFLRAREFEYVQAASVLGASRFRVMMKHILPNALTPVITFFPFRISGGISSLAALDFLGLGAPPPTPSLGELLAQGKSNLDSWWIMLSTFIVMVLTITMFNFIGEGIQKALDPKGS